MNSTRNIIIVTVTALMVLLARASWRVLAADGNSHEINIAGPSQAIPLGGAWIATLAEANIITEWTITPVNPEHTEFISVLRQVRPDPTFGGGFLEADRETDWVGQMVQTGWNTFESTVVRYGTKKVEDQPQPEIVYIVVMYGSGRLVDLNTIEAGGTTAIFLPEQDADGDGFPDEGQEPIYCGPYTLTSCKRVQIMPPCELTPPPQGQ